MTDQLLTALKAKKSTTVLNVAEDSEQKTQKDKESVAKAMILISSDLLKAEKWTVFGAYKLDYTHSGFNALVRDGNVLTHLHLIEAAKNIARELKCGLCSSVLRERGHGVIGLSLIFHLASKEYSYKHVN